MPTADAATRLRAARERAGLSQREAAQQLGVHYGSLNRYENGKMRIPADLLARAEDLSPDPRIPVADEARHEPSFWEGRMVGVRDLLQNAMASLQSADREVAALVHSRALYRETAPVERPAPASGRTGAGDERPTHTLLTKEQARGDRRRQRGRAG